MRTLLALGCVAALAACNGPESEPPVDEPVAEQTTATAGTGTPGTIAGTYAGTTEDGEEWSSTINSDGTYTDTVGNDVTETGNWTESAGRACFQPDDAELDEQCFTVDTASEEGFVVITNSEGEQLRLQRTAG